MRSSNLLANGVGPVCCFLPVLHQVHLRRFPSCLARCAPGERAAVPHSAAHGKERGALFFDLLFLLFFRLDAGLAEGAVSAGAVGACTFSPSPRLSPFPHFV